MKPSILRYSISFFFFGLLGALIFYGFDHSNEKSFDLSKFILRFFIFGIGGLLNVWLSFRIDKRKQSSHKSPT